MLCAVTLLERGKGQNKKKEEKGGGGESGVFVGVENDKIVVEMP